MERIAEQFLSHGEWTRPIRRLVAELQMVTAEGGVDTTSRVYASATARALARKDKSAAEALMPEFEAARRRCYAEQLEWSRLGRSGEVGVVFAETLNQSMVVYGRAIRLTTGGPSGLGTF